jgi:4-hydroxy-tetrahydrodipicolinate synthase
MQRTRRFSGVIAPVLTPFGADGAPDAERFVAHAQWLMASGCTALAPFGTTSEANSLGLDERIELLEELVDAGLEPSRLMPGTGMCSVTDAAILTQHAVDLGCGGVLMLPPFYYKAPSEEGLFRFFAEVIEEVGDDRLKIYLYHIPPVAQVGFTPGLAKRLRTEFPEIVVGMKDSSGDWANMKTMLETVPDLEFFPGSEVFLLPALRMGAAGTISATANIAPGPMRRLFDDWQAGGAEKLQEDIIATRNTVQAYPVVPLLKAVIAHYRSDPGWAAVRPPFTSLPAAEAAQAIKLLAARHGLQLEFAAAA